MGSLFLVFFVIVQMINHCRCRLPDVIGLRCVSSWFYRFISYVEGTIGCFPVILWELLSCICKDTIGSINMGYYLWHVIKIWSWREGELVSCISWRIVFFKIVLCLCRRAVYVTIEKQLCLNHFFLRWWLSKLLRCSGRIFCWYMRWLTLGDVLP